MMEKIDTMENRNSPAIRQIDEKPIISRKSCHSMRHDAVALINLCEISKARKHMFLRLAIYRAHFYKQNGRSLCIQLISLGSSI